MNRFIFCFDFGRVLVGFKPWSEVLKGIAESYGGDVDSIDELFCTRVGKYDYPCAMGAGLISFEQLYNDFLSSAGIKADCLSEYEFKKLYLSHLVPVEPVIDIVRHLKEKGYRVIAVSDGDYTCEYIEMMLRKRFGLIFDQTLISYRERIRKPELLDLIWQIKEKNGLTYFFFDDLEQNLAYARALGMEVLRIDVGPIGEDGTVKGGVRAAEGLKAYLNSVLG